MWLPTTPFPSPAPPPALLRVWEVWLFPKGFSGGDGMDLLSSPLTYSPVMPPFRSRMETTWPSPLSLVCWQWLKTFLKTTGTAAGLTWTYLLIWFIQELTYTPSMSLVRTVTIHAYSLWCLVACEGTVMHLLKFDITLSWRTVVHHM